MNCWKNNFNEKTLKQGLKYKNNVENISYDSYTFKASIKSKNEFNVELVLQDNLLFEMSCSCSKKSSCAHEAGVLYFLEEFPEILEDFADDSKHEKIADIDISADLKVISESKLKKFLKKEFKKDPKLKYNFIKQFSTESMIDSKAYERKFKRILRNGGKEFGYYKLHNMRTPLKKFIKKDIYTLIEQKEYRLAYRLLNDIMNLFNDQIYWDDDAWYEIAYYYREYIYFILENGEFSNAERAYVERNMSIINGIVL